MSWLTLNDGFYVSSYQPSSPSFTISPDNGEQGETLNVYISGDNGAQFTTTVDHILISDSMVILTHSMEQLLVGIQGLII